MNFRYNCKYEKNTSAEHLKEVICAVAEPSNKMFTVNFDFYFQNINNRLYRTGLSSLLMGTETIMLTFVSFFHNPFSRFIEILDELTMRGFDGGLVEKWFGNLNSPNSNHKNDEPGAQILTMEHLEMGFFFCGVPLALSIVAFLCEVSVKLLPRFYYWSVNFIVNKLTVRRFRNQL